MTQAVLQNDFKTFNITNLESLNYSEMSDIEGGSIWSHVAAFLGGFASGLL